MNVWNDLAKDFLAATEGSSKFKNADNLNTACQWGKASVVALTVAVVASALFSGPLGVFLLGLATLNLHDAYKIFDNVQKISEGSFADKAIQKAASQINGEKPYERVLNGTIFAHAMVKLFMSNLVVQR